MKKILVLFVLAIGFVSHANNSTITESIIVTDATFCDQNFAELENSYEFKTEVLLRRGFCTYTVTYNGVVQGVFSVPFVDEAFIGMACQLAAAQACDFIQSQGGTCP